jgi:hypothetical protein
LLFHVALTHLAQLVAMMDRHTALIHLVLLEIIKVIHGVLTHSVLQEAVMDRHTALIHLVLLEIIKVIHGVLTHSALQEAVMVQVVALTHLGLCGATKLKFNREILFKRFLRRDYTTDPHQL